ncbi:MAG: tyrosine--tRNA ligase [Rickettsiales bacterium]|nr:tyrosine--tRNA ligase [Rickettsiales bacterium]
MLDFAIMYKSEFLNIIAERGLLNQCTDTEALDELLGSGSVAGYWGADPTADSLHIGNLAALAIPRWFAKTGNKFVLLVGGATGRIGDPSGRDTERNLLSEETLTANIAGIKRSLSYIFGQDVDVVDNYDWFRKVGYIEFLRDYGRHFSVNEMLKRDSVRMRLEREQPLSFLEFNYSLFQAYDFVELYKTRGVRVQFGGADQWGNLVSGVDLARRLALPQLFALTCPLITDANGVKFGKSMGNAVWLNPDKVSDFDYYQFWRNVDDRDVGKLLAAFTDLPMDEVRRLGALQGAEINDAKKILAFEATKICRGETSAVAASATASATFEQGGIGVELPRVRVVSGVNVIEAFLASGLVGSKSEARRAIAGGGLYVDGKRVESETLTIDFAGRGEILISSGKKNKAVLVLK